MKKNILTIVIMAASVINLILTIVLIFSVMPAMNKTSNLIDKVSSLIDLEIESESEENAAVPMEDRDSTIITYEANVNINLKKETGEDSNHYAVISGVTVTYNKNEDDYEDVKALIDANQVYVNDAVSETIGAYTASTISQTAVKEEAVKKLQEMYDTKSIIDVSLSNFLVS